MGWVFNFFLLFVWGDVLFIFNRRIIALQYCVGFCHVNMNQP